MKKGSLKKYLLPNLPYLFMAWACLKLGTAYRLAAGMDGQVGEPVKSARSDILLGIGKEMSRAYREGLLGQERQVLMEEKMVIHGTKYLAGYTKEYVKAAVLWDETLKGKMVTGVLREMINDEVMRMDVSHEA